MGNGDTSPQVVGSNAADMSPPATSFPPVDNQGAVPANKNIDFVLDIPLQVTVQIEEHARWYRAYAMLW